MIPTTRIHCVCIIGIINHCIDCTNMSFQGGISRLINVLVKAKTWARKRTLILRSALGVVFRCLVDCEDSCIVSSCAGIDVDHTLTVPSDDALANYTECISILHQHYKVYIHILLLDPLQSIRLNPCVPCIQINILVYHWNTKMHISMFPSRWIKWITFQARILWSREPEYAITWSDAS